MVGPERFELSTSCTPCKRATRLRYGPNKRTVSKPNASGRRKRFFRRAERLAFATLRIEPKQSPRLFRLSPFSAVALFGACPYLSLGHVACPQYPIRCLSLSIDSTRCLSPATGRVACPQSSGPRSHPKFSPVPNNGLGGPSPVPNSVCPQFRVSQILRRVPAHGAGRRFSCLSPFFGSRISVSVPDAFRCL